MNDLMVLLEKLRMQSMIKSLLDSIPNVVPPSPFQIEIMHRIGLKSGVAIVQDKGAAFQLIGPKLKSAEGFFASKEHNPQLKVDTVMLNLNANDPYWYSALFHELAHATGTSERLNRHGQKRVKDPAEYCFEELIAESVARRIMDRLDLATQKTIDKSAKYLESYMNPLGYQIDIDKLQRDVEAAESMVLSWIESIDFKNTFKIA